MVLLANCSCHLNYFIVCHVCIYLNKYQFLFDILLRSHLFVFFCHFINDIYFCHLSLKSISPLVFHYKIVESVTVYLELRRTFHRKHF